MTRYVRCWSACLLAAFALVYAPAALACACCTQTGWRYVEVEKTSLRRMAEIDQIKFAKTAKLMLGEANEDGIKGVKDPSEDYQLTMTRQKDRMVFSFRDEKGRAGTLTLVTPQTISIFEVDPRGDVKDAGYGPVLFKEWKLTANAAGDGLFRGLVGPGQKITLVLHGRGGGCTDASHFTDWTLLVHGKDTITLYGALDSAAK